MELLSVPRKAAEPTAGVRAANPFDFSLDPLPAFPSEHWLGVGDVRQDSAESFHKVVEFRSKDSTLAAERIDLPEVLHFDLR